MAPVILKTLKIVFPTSLPNTQQYKIHIKGKVEQSRERSSALTNLSRGWSEGSLFSSYYTNVVATEKGAFWSTSTKVTNFTFLFHRYFSPYIYCLQCIHKILYSNYFNFFVATKKLAVDSPEIFWTSELNS